MFALRNLKKLTKSQLPLSFLQANSAQKFFPLYKSPYACFATKKSGQSDKAQKEAEKFSEQYGDPLKQQFNTSAKETEDFIANTKRRAEKTTETKNDHESRKNEDMASRSKDTMNKAGEKMSETGSKMSETMKDMGNTIRDAARGVAQSVTENLGSGLGQMTDSGEYKGEEVRPNIDNNNQKVGSFAPDRTSQQNSNQKDAGFESSGREKPDLRASAREDAKQKSAPQPGFTTNTGVDQSNSMGTMSSKGEQRNRSDESRSNQSSFEEQMKEHKKETEQVGAKPADMRRTTGMASTTTQTKETSTEPESAPKGRELDERDTIRVENEMASKGINEVLGGGSLKNEYDNTRKKEFEEEKVEAVSTTDEVIELVDSWDWGIVERSGKPVIVDFYKPYDTESRRVYSQLVSKFKDQTEWVLAGANVDKLQELAKKMQVESVPTFFLLHEGRIVEKIDNLSDLDKLIEKATDLGKQTVGTCS